MSPARVLLEAGDRELKFTTSEIQCGVEHILLHPPFHTRMEDRKGKKKKKEQKCLLIVCQDLNHRSQTAMINCPSLSIRMMDADTLGVVFLPRASWENLFLISPVRSIDAKRTYFLEAYLNPEGQLSHYFSSKPTPKLLLGGFLPCGIRIVENK